MQHICIWLRDMRRDKVLEDIALARNLSPVCVPLWFWGSRQEREEKVEETERGLPGSTPGVEIASSGQDCRRMLPSFHIIPDHKCHVA